jgi:hypothetical protein
MAKREPAIYSDRDYLEAHFSAIREDIAEVKSLAAHGVQANNRIDKLESKLSTIWAVVLALPVIGAALAFFLPEHYSNAMPNQHQQ